MQLSLKTVKDPAALRTGCLVLPVTEGAPLGGAAEIGRAHV